MRGYPLRDAELELQRDMLSPKYGFNSSYIVQKKTATLKTLERILAYNISAMFSTFYGEEVSIYLRVVSAKFGLHDNPHFETVLS